MRFAVSAALGGLALVIGTVAIPAAAQDNRTAVKQQAGTAAPAGPITVSGVLRLRIVLKVSPSLPDGTQITFQPSASVSDTSFSSAVGASGKATVSGGRAGLTLNMPYTWQVASTSDTVSISVSASGAVNASGGVSYSNASGFSRSIPLPANGATTVVDFSGSI